jgi:hypothetical protein
MTAGMYGEPLPARLRPSFNEKGKTHTTGSDGDSSDEEAAVEQYLQDRRGMVSADGQTKIASIYDILDSASGKASRKGDGLSSGLEGSQQGGNKDGLGGRRNSRGPIKGNGGARLGHLRMYLGRGEAGLQVRGSSPSPNVVRVM